MMSVIEQTRDEQIAMYLKLTKRELTERLVNANEALMISKPAVATTDYRHVNYRYVNIDFVPDYFKL